MSQIQPDLRRKAGTETRERMLAAAEIVFAEKGYDGASTRALSEAAGADVAMIVYHFGSKLGLYREMMTRRGTRLNAVRLAELRAVMSTSKGPPDVYAVTHALVATNIRMRSDSELGGLPVARLIARELIDPSEHARLAVEDMFSPVAAEFIAAYRVALPTASAEAVYWAYFFAISTMVQTMANVALLENLSQGKCDMKDSERVIARLVPFITGGILRCIEFNDTLHKTGARSRAAKVAKPLTPKKATARKAATRKA